MPMRGIDNDQIAFGIDQRPRIGHAFFADGGCRRYPQPARCVLGRLRVIHCLLNILDRNQPDTVVIRIDHQQFFDPPLVQQPPCFFLTDTRRNGRQIFVRHQFGNKLVGMFGKAHVTVGKDACQPAAGFHDRNARNRIVRHDRSCFGQRCIRGNSDRIDHHSRFKALHLTNCRALFLDRKVAVQDSDATQLRHDNCHPRFGYGIHRRRKHRNVERNGLGQARPCVRLARQDRRSAGLQQHVVEGKAKGDVSHGAAALYIGSRPPM